MDYAKINLLKIRGACEARLNGKNGVFIPTDANPIFYVGKKGIYMGLKFFKRNVPDQFGSYGFVSGSITTQEGRALPDTTKREYEGIIGNLTAVFESSNTGGENLPEVSSISGMPPVYDAGDDLPV